MRLDRYDQGGYAGGGITENGGNISGPLVLAGNPSQTLEAVPKQYVDAYFNSLNASNLTAGTLAAARLPAFTGDLQSTAGTSQLSLVNSGVVAGEHGKVTVNSKGIITGGGNITNDDIPFGLPWNKINPASLPSTLSGYGITNGINLSGGTLTGFLSVTNQPTLGSHVATKQYVDALVSGGGIAVGDILRKPYSTTPAGFLKCNGGLVDKTTYSSLYAIIGDRFTSFSTLGSGKPWQQQYGFNTNINEGLGTFTVNGNLPGLLRASQIAVTKNKVYVLGGWDSTATYVSTVYSATINTDGTLGTWITDTPLPIPIIYSSVIVVKNKIYMIGGYTNMATGQPTTTVLMGTINSTGSITSWGYGNSLPDVAGNSPVFITNNYLYVISGSVIYYATINTNGTLGAWSILSNSVSLLNNHYSDVIVTLNRVYLIGQISGYSSNAAILYATINTDGTLGKFNYVSDFPYWPVNARLKAVVTRYKAYFISNSSADPRCFSATINTDGSLGSFSPCGEIPTNMGSDLEIFVSSSKLYILCSYITQGVYSTNFGGGLNDYSPYYDGTNDPSLFLNKFAVPDLSTDEPFGSYSYIKY